jgi:hypothetical protein
MAHTIVNLENPRTGQRRQAPIGFSWTNLFFGFFVPLVRGDWKWAVIQFFAALFTGGLCWLVFPFIYNRLYASDLARNGYTLVEGESSDGAQQSPPRQVPEPNIPLGTPIADINNSRMQCHQCHAEITEGRYCEKCSQFQPGSMIILAELAAKFKKWRSDRRPVGIRGAVIALVITIAIIGGMYVTFSYYSNSDSEQTSSSSSQASEPAPATTPATQLLSKTADFPRFNFKKIELPDDILQWYSPSLLAKAKEIASRVADIQDAKLRKAAADEEWHKVHPEPFVREALEGYLKERTLFLQQNRDMFFEVGSLFTYEANAATATFLLDDDSPVGHQCWTTYHSFLIRPERTCPSLTITIAVRQMDAVYSIVRHDPQWNDQLDRIRLVAKGEYSQKAITQLYLMDYNTEQILLDLGNPPIPELSPDNWFVPEALSTQKQVGTQGESPQSAANTQADVPSQSNGNAVPAERNQAAHAAPTPGPTIPASPSPIVSSSAGLDGSTRSTDSAEPEFFVLFRALEDSWVSITADGKPIMKGTLIARRETTVRAKQRITMLVGNAAGIEFSFNGQSQVVLGGKSNEVRTVVFTPSGLQP